MNALPYASSFAGTSLCRYIYGLKQAAHDWNQLLRRALLDWGFTQSQADPCLYVHLERKVWLLVYVDDIAIAVPKKCNVTWFQEILGVLSLD